MMKTTWEERVYLAYCSTSLFIVEGSQNSNSGGRSWFRRHGGELLTGLFFMTCSACFFIEPRTNSPGMAPLTVDWALLYWSLIKKMPCRFAYSLLLQRIFPTEAPSLLFDDSSLCQLDIKPASTQPQGFQHVLGDSIIILSYFLI